MNERVIEGPSQQEACPDFSQVKGRGTLIVVAGAFRSGILFYPI